MIVQGLIVELSTLLGQVREARSYGEGTIAPHKFFETVAAEKTQLLVSMFHKLVAKVGHVTTDPGTCVCMYVCLYVCVWHAYVCLQDAYVCLWHAYV